MITLAHLSDPHLDGGGQAAQRAAAVARVVRDLAVDAILVSGDIVDHGTTAEYAEAAAWLSTLPSPVLVLPGNHDHRAPFRAGLTDFLVGATSGEEINQVTRVGQVDVLLADSTIPGEDGGRLSSTTLEWLDLNLAVADTPALICFHHPPLALHAPYVDSIRQTGEAALLDIMTRHPRVAAVLCGHAHTAAFSTFAGRPVVVAPGIVSTIRTAFEPGVAATIDEPPGIALHVMNDEGSLITHIRSVAPACVSLQWPRASTQSWPPPQ